MKRYCNKACEALHEYEENAKMYDDPLKPNAPTFIPRDQSLFAYASIYGVSVEEMKKHWPCVDRSNNG